LGKEGKSHHNKGQRIPRPSADIRQNIEEYETIADALQGLFQWIDLNVYISISVNV
jgi:hypothetical protein